MERKKLLARFFALLKALGLGEGEKFQLITSHSHRANDSLKAMTDAQLAAMVKTLQRQQDEAMQPMRGRVIRRLCELGMVKEDGKPDYARIDNYVMHIGKNNPRMARLSFLYHAELSAVLKQVEAWANKSLSEKQKD